MQGLPCVVVSIVQHGQLVEIIADLHITIASLLFRPVQRAIRKPDQYCRVRRDHDDRADQSGPDPGQRREHHPEHCPRPYLMNAWYAAALSREVGQALFHRKILDTSVLIYRKEDGTPVALHDRCPRHFAPLHLGKRQGDEVICIYHALRFDGTGRCTHNAHGATAASPAHRGCARSR